MHPHLNLPAPKGRIWAACYMDSTTECFELRTKTDAPGVPFTLYHKEYPIGTALTDFLYFDVKLFPIYIEQLKIALEEIRKGNNVKRQFLHLFDMAIFLLHNSPIFAPLAAAIQRQRLLYDEGKELDTTEIEAQMAYYTQLQSKIQYLAEHFFEAEEPENMIERYLDQRIELGEKQSSDFYNYLPLIYGEVTYGRVTKGANGFFPYDDKLNEEQRNDFQDFYAEVVDTESPEHFVQFVLAEYIRRNLRFRTCKFCGRYFGITGNTRIEFCDRLIDGSKKTCKEMGSVRLYDKRVLENPALREYKRSYKAHNARIRYGLMTKDEFRAWSKEARQKRDACLAGQLSLEEFVIWLDSDKQS